MAKYTLSVAMMALCVTTIAGFPHTGYGGRSYGHDYHRAPYDHSGIYNYPIGSHNGQYVRHYPMPYGGRYDHHLEYYDHHPEGGHVVYGRPYEGHDRYYGYGGPYGYNMPPNFGGFHDYFEHAGSWHVHGGYWPYEQYGGQNGPTGFDNNQGIDYGQEDNQDDVGQTGQGGDSQQGEQSYQVGKGDTQEGQGGEITQAEQGEQSGQSNQEGNEDKQVGQVGQHGQGEETPQAEQGNEATDNGQQDEGGENTQPEQESQQG